MPVIEASRAASNSASSWRQVRPSVSARERLGLLGAADVDLRLDDRHEVGTKDHSADVELLAHHVVREALVDLQEGNDGLVLAEVLRRPLQSIRPSIIRSNRIAPGSGLP
jgi:hypothetical protein